MRKMRRIGGVKIGLAVALVCQSCVLTDFMAAQAQQSGAGEIGVVYYADGPDFKALTKEKAAMLGRKAEYSGKVKGAHSDIRLTTGQQHVFRVCGVDPTRYKLYRFKSSGDWRSVAVAKVSVWVSESKNILSESEIPVTIQAANGNCYAVSAKETLTGGEYGFMPLGADDVFMFGVGDAK